MANVPIGDDLMEVIGPRGEGLVFNGLTTYMLTYPMKRWFNSIGIKKDLHFHCTRHTYATLSLALGTDIITIKNVLGHKQESTTMRYTKVVNPLKEQAAKRLSINNNQVKTQNNMKKAISKINPFRYAKKVAYRLYLANSSTSAISRWCYLLRSKGV